MTDKIIGYVAHLKKIGEHEIADKLETLAKEREAAVGDLHGLCHACVYDGHDVCGRCVHSEVFFCDGDAALADNWEWRGAQ